MSRLIAVTSPLGPDKLLFRRLSGAEILGQPFRYDIDFYSEDRAIEIDRILGEALCISLETETGSQRYFHGYVTEFSQIDSDSLRYAAYRATIRPWIWFLSRSADCRIFKGTIPDIAKQVFGEFGFADFDNRLEDEHGEWEYCVQYRETSLNFLARLFEQEGIYYYHEHEKGKHTLVLCDGYGGHRRIAGYEKLPYYPRDPDRQRDREHVFSWQLTKSVQPGVFVQKDFDFTKPKANMKTEAEAARDYTRSSFEVFDYPGEYEEPKDGDTYAKIRIDELQVSYEQALGESDARGLQTGALFNLTNFPQPRNDQNREYIVTATNTWLECNDHESDGGESATRYGCSFRAMDSRQTFRPPRITPKPLISGPQTAIVVGKAGEEIWTDEHGRVKVQFHWDRRGKSDENSSCWVRVSQGWAGKSWGSFHLPRIGQEVIVEFLEGDPDWPIITGRVYNGDNKPPYGLPANKTVSTVMSRSSIGGGADNFNEIKFEDKKGSELLFVQAEKDREVKVKNDNTETVGNDEKTTISNNQTLEVGKDRTGKIGSNDKLEVGQNYSVNAGMKIELTTGAASVKMTNDGTIKITGIDVTIETAAGKININAAGIVTIQGTLVKIN